MEITSELIRAARALLRWEQKDLAAASGVSLPSIKRLETQPGLLAAQDRTVAALRAALELAGVEFTNGSRPGVRMRTLEIGDEVKLRSASSQHAGSFGVTTNEVLKVVDWQQFPGDPPWGRIRLRSSDGKLTDYVEPSHFERAR